MFRTYEPERDRLVAVKVFRLDITPEQAQALADELSRAAEAGLFHPSIVEPIAAGVEGSVAYNAEEYVAAESLDVAMRHYAPAQPAAVLPYVTQLAGAIDFARAAGVGHGALHPRDVFVTPDEARVTGFGVVEALERVGLRAPVRRPYSPPERIAGQTWSTEADVFSLAAITYELLTGRRPAGLGREIGPIAEAQHLQEVLARAMDEKPTRRYPSALAFASALEAAARTGTAAAPETPPQTTDVPSNAGIAAAATPLMASSSGSRAAAMPPSGPVRPNHDEIEDDVAAEREEDEAHHRLTRQELEVASAREAVPEQEEEFGLDEDSEIEAEADRYSGDDFLLDAAGAASAPELGALDNFGGGGAAIDRRALEDDELMVDEPPSPLFQPGDLRHRAEDRSSGSRESLPSPSREPEYSRQPAPSLLGHAAPTEEPEARSKWPLALTLLLGLLLGFAAGYAVWGGAVAPGAREWSEQAVSGTPAAPSGPPASTPPSSSTVAAPAAGGGATSAASGGAGREVESAEPAPATPKAPAAERPAEKPPKPATGTLVVRSTPSGAGVTINGRWRGRTPLTLENLSFARYDIRVVQPGYAAGREAVTLSASEPDRSVSLRLEQQARTSAPSAQRGRARARPAEPSSPQRYTGAVFVDSRPRGARVFIDGKQVGVTPLSIPDIPVGSHVVRLELPDHRIWSTTATVSSGQQARVTGSLERIQ